MAIWAVSCEVAGARIGRLALAGGREIVSGRTKRTRGRGLKVRRNTLTLVVVFQSAACLTF